MSQNDCEGALSESKAQLHTASGTIERIEADRLELEAALSEAQQERDRQYEFNIGQIATQAALEQQLSEAHESLSGAWQVRDQALAQLSQAEQQVAQQAATISQLRDALEKAKHGLETAGMGARYIDQALAKDEL